MNSDEQTLIDGLFSRLRQAEKDAGPRDAQADQRIKEHLASQPAVAYYMAQAILVQEAALKKLDQQNKQLQQELETARAQPAAQPAAQPPSGGFLSSLFGSGAREATPPPAPSTGGWREPARPAAYNNPPQQPYNAAPPSGFQQPGMQQPGFQQAAPAGSGFLGGALKTAAGVAGGVMLAQGISSLFHHNAQPEEIVEVIKEQPAEHVADSGNLDSGNHDVVNNDTGGNDWNGNEPNAGGDSWASNDPGGFGSADSADDSGFFSDDDYV